MTDADRTVDDSKRDETVCPQCGHDKWEHGVEGCDNPRCECLREHLMYQWATRAKPHDQL